MKRWKKFTACMLSVMLVMAFGVTAFAAEEKAEEKTIMEDGNSEGYGVKVTSTVDKEQYISGDEATLTLTVENKNDYNLKNVNIQLIGSNQVKYKENAVKIGNLKAGEKQEIQVVGTVTSDTAAPLGMKIGDKFVGIGPILGVAGAVLAVIVVLVVLIVMIVKKKGKKAAASGLIIVLLAGSMFGAPLNTKAISVHDPSIVKDPTSGKYYVFGSHLAFGKSDDLLSWSTMSLNINSDFNNLFGDVWANYGSTQKNSKLDGNMWAPDVTWNDTMKKWCMYMSINGNDWHSAIVLLTADNIEGPYEYVDEVVFSGFWDKPFGSGDVNTLMGEKSLHVNSEDITTKMKITFVEESAYESRLDYTDVKKVLGDNVNIAKYKSTDKSCVNAIDPVVTYDEEGNLWMTYGSWSAGIYQLKIDLATGLRDYNYKYPDEDNKSDAYLGYKIAGGFYNSGEGPYIIKADKYYYLFISLGNLEASGGYNMRVYRSENINGPYVDQNGVSSILTYWDASIGFQAMEVTSKYNTKKGLKLLGAYEMYGVSKPQVAQGHNSALVDEDGKIYLVYHTRFANSGEGHEMRVHQMFVNEDGWLVAAPYSYSGETLPKDGYKANEIAGNYEFVLHDPAKVYVETATTPDKGIVKSEAITLGADGTISGAHSGTWKITKGANVVLTIDGKEYKGVFLKQKTESTNEEIMTFTAVGNNLSIWGVQPPK